MSKATPIGSSEFSAWRAYLWPVHSYELKKLIPMLFIFFFISFNYNILRTLKDSLLVTAESSGAEVIPFVKVWGVFPGAVLMTFFFAWLSNRLSQEKVFYIIISFFLIYFAVFTFILYPIRDLIHPHALSDSLEKMLPLGCKGLIAMFRYWTFTLFYVMSELWSSAVLSVLFWGFANQVTQMQDAKRFYGLFGVGANFSGIFAGQLSVFCCSYTRQGGVLPIGEDAWHQSLILMISLILGAGLISLLLFRWMHLKALIDVPSSSSVQMGQREQKKLSLKDSLSYLTRSPYLLYITLIVLSYNVVINLTEVLWKHEAKLLYPDPNDYTMYMNEIVSIIGGVSTLASLFISGSAVRKFGWTATALITPFILLLTSLGFFGAFFLKEYFPSWNVLWMGLTPVAFVVFLGSLQNVLSRGAKYSVFDATKEMAFVPLSSDSKLIGKAAIDGVCSRLGKSGGSIIYQGLLLLCSSLPACAPYASFVLVGIIGVWIGAIRLLGKQFNELTSKPESAVSIVPIEPVLSPRSSRIELLTDHSLLKEPRAV